jgi:hypothetical protein
LKGPLGIPVKICVEDMQSFLEKKIPMEYSLHFDGDKTLTVKKLDGGVMMTFQESW